MSSTRRKFVAYDIDENVIAEVEPSEKWPTLEFFAAHHPNNECAEIVNSREVRTIPPAA